MNLRDRAEEPCSRSPDPISWLQKDASQIATRNHKTLRSLHLHIFTTTTKDTEALRAATLRPQVVWDRRHSLPNNQYTQRPGDLPAKACLDGGDSGNYGQAKHPNHDAPGNSRSHQFATVSQLPGRRES